MNNARRFRLISPLILAAGCASHPLAGGPIDERVVAALRDRTADYREVYQPALAEADAELGADFALDLDADAALVERLQAALDRQREGGRR